MTRLDQIRLTDKLTNGPTDLTETTDSTEFEEVVVKTPTYQMTFGTDCKTRTHD